MLGKINCAVYMFLTSHDYCFYLSLTLFSKPLSLFNSNSGGISRDWTGFPRKYFQPGAKSFRCACVPEQELDNPHFKMYDNCDPKAISCKLAGKNE